MRLLFFKMTSSFFMVRILPSVAFWLTVSCLTFWVYWPGIHGPFVFDDFANIVENNSVHINSLNPSTISSAAFSTSTGPLSRPIPMASFALNYYFAGLNEFWFKATNVFLHIANGILLWFVARQILSRNYDDGSGKQIATVGATVCLLCWIFHPLHVTSVLYVVQRMVELSSFFGLCAVLFYLKAREKKSLQNAIWLQFCAFSSVVLAVLCKENLVILVPLLAFLEFSLFRKQPEKSKQILFVRFLRVILLLGVIVLFAYIAIKFPDFIRGYNFRPFTMGERLLTESRILWIYFGQIILPDISRMHLFHDEIIVSKSILSPLTTLAAIFFMIAAITCAWLMRRSHPLVYIAIGWFLIGHAIESSFISLELMHAHRNYFPMMGFFILLGAMGVQLYEKSSVLMMGLLLIMVTALGLSTRHRAMDWSTWEILVVTEAEKNSLSARSQYEAGRYFYWVVEKAGKDKYDLANYNKALFYFERGTASSQSSLASLAAMIRLNDRLGKKQNPIWLKELLLRISTERPDPNDINKVVDLFRCRMMDACQVDVAFLSEIAAAVMKSERLPTFTKSAILSSAATVALKEGRPDFAVYYSMSALEASPNTFEFLKNALALAKITKDIDLARMLMQVYFVNFHDDAQRSLMKSEYEIILKEASKGDKRVQ